tara:strand:- start:124 stop:606 length:483 start_codon:yes stop_codon:yes gene_type:complete
MQIIPKFIQEPEIFQQINNTLNNSNFPWFYSGTTADLYDSSDYLFYHWLYRDGNQMSEHFNKILIPLIGRLHINSLIRCKVNLYTKKSKHIKTNFHTDSPEAHKVALFSINTNNGYTLFKNKEKALSVENTMVLFDGSIPHCSVAQTDENVRLNININYK